MRRVVITGIGAVSPNGIGRERFWEATRNGVSGVRRITRFDPSAYQVQVAGEVPDEFDEKQYVEIKDRPHVSRAVPLAAASVAEAVADAGLDVASMSRDELRGIGVIVGSGGGSMDFTEEQYRLYYAGLIKQCSVYTIPTGTIGTLASEVSMRFGFRGLSHIVSTGCTSSTDAMGYAYRNIQMGILDTVVTGGVDSPIAPLILRGFQLMRIMTTRWNHAPERASRPFSRDRDGFVIAEGAWFFVLEERERAEARGAPILGEVAGYGSTCEAYHRVRLEECGEEPARAIGMALEEAGVEPAAVVDLGQQLVLVPQGQVELLPQDAGVKQVLHPDAHPGDLVAVGRADAPAGGADPRLAQEPLADLVQRPVVRHDQVRAGAVLDGK